ncbi:MAG: antibiotic biosynthesis monooxygenase family protein, partial [Candidatus Saccharicenans sp.]
PLLFKWERIKLRLESGIIMIARLTFIRIKPEDFEEAVRIYENSVVPEAKLQKGFRGGYLFNDAASGKGIALTLWTSLEDLVTSENNLYYQNQLIKFPDKFVMPPIKEEYNVLLQY